MKYLITAMALLIALSLAGTTSAKEKGKHGLRGKIVSVDSSSMVIKAHGKDGKRSVTVATDADTAVTIDGKSAKVSDLTAGLFVRVDPSEGTATMIVASTTKPQHKHGAKKNVAAPTTNP